MTLWSSTYIGIHIGLKSFDPYALALFRYLVASFCMLVIWIKVTPKRKPTLLELFIIFLLGGLGIAFYNIMLNYGQSSIMPATASFILLQMPVFIVFLSIIFLKERLTLLNWVGIIISICGITIIMLGQSSEVHVTLAMVCLLAAALANAIFSVAQKKFLKKFTPIEFNAYIMWSGTIILLFYFPHLTEQLPQATLSSIMAAIYNGIFPAAIAYVLWGYATHHLDASKMGSSLYLTPLIVTVLSLVILREQPTLPDLLGGLVALLGVILANRKKPIRITMEQIQVSNN